MRSFWCIRAWPSAGVDGWDVGWVTVKTAGKICSSLHLTKPPAHQGENSGPNHEERTGSRPYNFMSLNTSIIISKCIKDGVTANTITAIRKIGEVGVEEATTVPLIEAVKDLHS